MTYLKENYKSILAYTGIFLVLLAGSGLVKIPVGSVLFYVIKFTILLGVLGLGIYFYYKQQTTHYLQLALFVPFTIDFHLHYAFIFLTIILFNKKLLLPWNSPIKPIYLLFIWGFISYVINQFIEFNPLSFPLFIGTFFLPFIFFSLFYINIKDGNWLPAMNFYLKIITIMLVIIFAQTILLWNFHPDFRDGGTNHAHMAGIYLSIGLLLICYKYFQIKKISVYETILIFASLVAMFFMDVKYIMFFLAIALLPFVYLLMKENKKLKIAFAFGVPAILILWVLVLEGRVYHSVLSLEDQNYKVIDLAKNYPNSVKGKLITDYGKMVKEHPINAVFGTGPGTFLSYAAYLNSNVYLANWRNDYQGYFYDIMNAIRTANKKVETWSREKYAYGEKYFFEGANKTSFYDWRSSLVSLLYEIGMIGALLLMTFMFAFLKIKKSKKYYLSELSLLFFFTSMILFDLWYEFPSYAITQYSVIGLILAKRRNFINDHLLK